MFTIIGGDGNQYGPVAMQTLREWINDSRVDLDTLAVKSGDDNWRRLGDYPEFAEPARAALPPPAPWPPAPFVPTTQLPPNASVQIDPAVYANELIARARTLDIGSCLERSWNLLRASIPELVGVTALIVVIMAVIQSVPLIGPLAGIILAGVFYGGLYSYYLKKVRGQPAKIDDAFAGFQIAFVPLMLASLVSGLLTGVGFLLLLLPGIYLAVSYVFTVLLVIDQRLEFWSAMEVSRRVVTAQWFSMFALLLVGGVIAGLGLLGFFIGFFFTLPILLGAIVYAYEDLCNPPAHT